MLPPFRMAALCIVVSLLFRGGATDEERRKVRFSRTLTRFAAGLMVAAGLFLAGVIYYQQWTMAELLRHGAYTVVEGQVTEFVPEPPEGHVGEHFRVGAARFSYATYRGTGAFNRTHPAGGPIRDGQFVRIAYANGDILRLEIAR